MKPRCYFLFLSIFLLCGMQRAGAQLGFDLDIKKPAPYENRELKSEKSGAKKFTVPRRVLQNAFTHYNYFFNANNKLNEVVDRAKLAFKEDYAKLLPFYNYQLSVTAQDKGELDSVIYKSKTGVLLHDLRNDWIDDMYLLWGQAYYLQEQYDSAYQMFQFINYAFADKEKDGYYKHIGSQGTGGANRIATDETAPWIKRMISDPPARNAALLWEVRSLTGAGAMTEASSLIAALRTDPLFPERLRPDLEEVQAFWFYKQERWDSAALHLTGALDNAKTAQERARWEYLAAQLFQRSMQTDQATAFYNKAITHTIDPVLELYARLNLIRINKSGGEDYIDQNIAALLKMAKRDKYTDFRDAIYYMAGEMELARSNWDKAQEYFLKASKYKGEDPAATERGFLQLADLFYSQKNYVPAAQFYDSVQSGSLPEETLQQIAERRDLLAGLINQLNIVQRQDSLQRIAALPEKERGDYVKRLVRQLRRQRGLADETATTNTNPAAENLSREREGSDLFQTGSTKGEWYFYNASTRTQGAAAFTRIWGKRPNVDNWRRATDMFTQLEANSPGNTRGTPGQLTVDESTSLSYDGLLKNLPLNEAALQVSNDSIANALFTTGRMYTDKFEDYESAIKTYEELRRRFPAFQSTEEVLFQLYFSYTKAGNSAKAAEIKALLEKSYPGGHYTTIATTGKNPNTNNDAAVATKAYEAVYDLFIEGKFGEATAAKRTADSLYGTTVWNPQLLYIEAVYNIKLGADNAAKQVLTSLIEQSGDAPIGQKATTLLEVLNRRQEIEDELRNLEVERPAEEPPVVAVPEKKPVDQPAATESEPEPEETFVEPGISVNERRTAPVTDTEKKRAAVTDKAAPLRRDSLSITPTPLPNRPKIYTYAAEERHYVMVLLNKVDAVFGNEAKNAFARYNRERWYNMPLELNVIPLDAEYKLLSIGLFQNAQGAVDYVQRAKPLAPTEIVPWLKNEKYRFTIISESNLKLLQEKADLPGYETFLEANLPVKF